ncbi:MAG: hypothetical protein C4332_15915 [Meiothermus sp.]
MLLPLLVARRLLTGAGLERNHLAGIGCGLGNLLGQAKVRGRALVKLDFQGLGGGESRGG